MKQCDETVAALALPTSITIYLSMEERRQALKKLRAIDRDRRRALLRALGVDGSHAKEARHG